MLRVHTFTEAGGHLTNEDAFEVRPHPEDSGNLLCFLADGQGGQAGGGLAARIACQDGMSRCLGTSLSRLQSTSAWVELMSAVDLTVATTEEAGYTTLIGLCQCGDMFFGASSGDSAVVAFSGGDWFDLTQHQHKNPSVGSGKAPFVPFTARFRQPWRVLIVSDGVWKYIPWESLRESALTLAGEDLLTQLQKLGRLPGSGRFQDDFTVVLMEGLAWIAHPG